MDVFTGKHFGCSVSNFLIKFYIFCRKQLNDELKRQMSDDTSLAGVNRSVSRVTESSVNQSHSNTVANASKWSASMRDSSSSAGGASLPQVNKENLMAFKSDHLPVCGDSFFDESLSASWERTPFQNGLCSTLSDESCGEDVRSPMFERLETSFSSTNSAFGQKKNASVSYTTPISNVKNAFEFKSPGASVSSSAVKSVNKPSTNTSLVQQAANEHFDREFGGTLTPEWTSNKRVNQLTVYQNDTDRSSSPSSSIALNIRDRPLNAPANGQQQLVAKNAAAGISIYVTTLDYKLEVWTG